jgi:hypothetical protein
MANGNKAGKNPKTGGNVGNEPTDPTLTEGYDPTSTGTYKGLGNTDISKTGTAYDNYVKKMNEKFLTAHDRIFNTSGVLMFTKNLGLNNEDLMNVSSALQKEIRSVKSGGGYRFTPAEKTASNKLTNLLLQNEGVKAAGIKDIKGPYGLRNALVAYAKDYLEDRNEQSKDGIAFLKSDEMNALMDYVTANQDLAAYEANEKKRNELVKRNILGDPKTYGKIIVDRNGEKDILTPTDMAKDMPSLELFGTIDGSVLKLSKQQVAEAYAQGELSGTRIGELTYNGKNYTFRKVNDKTSSTAFGLADNTAALWNDIYSNVLVPKYGTPDELNKLLTAANTSVVPDLLFYQSQTGKMGVEFSYTFDNKKPLAQDKGARIFNAALSTANSEFYDIDGKPLSTDMIQKITSLLNGEDAWEKYVDKFDYVTQGINGLPTIRFSISDKPSESGKAGVDVSAIKSQIFNLAILPTNTSPDLRDLPNNTGMYMYDQLLRGETVKSDPVISASGFEFEIVPNNNTDPDKVNVSLKYNIRVNNRLPSGEIVTSIKPFSAEESFNLKGSGAKTPDEVVSYIYSLYFRNMEQNKMTQEEYNRTLSTNPGTTTVSKEQYLNSKGVKLK